MGAGASLGKMLTAASAGEIQDWLIAAHCRKKLKAAAVASNKPTDVPSTATLGKTHRRLSQSATDVQSTVTISKTRCRLSQSVTNVQSTALGKTRRSQCLKMQAARRAAKRDRAELRSVYSRLLGVMLLPSETDYESGLIMALRCLQTVVRSSQQATFAGALSSTNGLYQQPWTTCIDAPCHRILHGKVCQQFKPSTLMERVEPQARVCTGGNEIGGLPAGAQALSTALESRALVSLEMLVVDDGPLGTDESNQH